MKGSNVTVTLDLLLLLVVVVLLSRGAGKTWLQTLFTYQPVSLNLNPLAGINLNPFPNNPSDTIPSDPNNPNSPPIHVPGAGGDPQIAPGVG